MGMKIQTNAGEVELTAEMVRKGMVFQADNWIHVDARDGVLTIVERDPGSEAWSTTVESWCFPQHAQRFLGCDPTIATRADCEVYGIVPGIDAGTHGFARLRAGGAVDLRRERLPVGSIVLDVLGARTPTATRSSPPLVDSERFIGLDMRHARAEDVEQLCCSTRDERGYLCALAIGDHDQHEDLATGVRWAAKPSALRGSITTSDGVRHTVDIDARGGVTTTSETDEALRARLRVADMAGRIARHVAGEPEPGTPAWIEALIAQGGYTCEVKRAARGPGTVDVMVHGASWAYCVMLRRRLVDEMPGHVDVLVEPSPEKADSRAVAGVRARRGGEAGADARTAWGTQQVATGNALDMLAGEREMRRGHGETDMALRGRIHPEIAGEEMGQRGPVSQAVRPRVVVHQGMVTLSGLDGYVMLDGGKVRVWTYRDGEVREVPPSEYDVVRLDDIRPATAEDAAYGAEVSPDTVAIGGWSTCTGCGAVEESIGNDRTIMRHEEDCSVMRAKVDRARELTARRAREAPLVALVNACPEGLDPVGWRCAVLGYTDEPAPDNAFDNLRGHVVDILRSFAALRSKGVPDVIAAERVVDEHPKGTGRICQVLLNYARALQPTTHPAPHRRKAAGLPCDDGRDE
jgi:hypothetical protein